MSALVEQYTGSKAEMKHSKQVQVGTQIQITINICHHSWQEDVPQCERDLLLFSMFKNKM